MDNRKDAYDISDELKTLLIKENTVLPISLAFSKLPTNAQRIRFCCELLRERGLMPAHAYMWSDKSTVKSNAARSRGNELYQKNKFVPALEAYNEALCWAPHGSECMGTAYANRSIIYLRVGMFGYCKANIKLACENNYPDAKQGKLRERLKNAEQSKNDETIAVPELRLTHPANPKMPFAIDGLEYANSDEFGRYVKTKIPLSPGDIIVLEKPFFQTLLRTAVYSQCFNCASSHYFNLFPCQKSSMAMFCSDECFNDAWQRFYQFEHKIIDGIFELFTKISINSIRASVRAFTMTTFDELKRIIDNVDVATENAFNVDYSTATQECEQFPPVYALATNETGRTVADTFQRANLCAIAWYMLKEYTPMRKIFADNPQKEDMFLELLMKFNQAAAVNYHCISECMRISEGPDLQLAAFTPRNYGSGAFALCSLINHSCAPNVVRFSVSGTNVIMVVRPVEVGGQIFDNYGPHHCLNPLNERKKILKDQYRFDCQCVACQGNYPMCDELPNLNLIPHDISHKFNLLRSDKTYDTATLELAHELYREISCLLQQEDKHYPCYDISKLQEALFVSAHALFYAKPMELIFVPKMQ